MTTLYEVTISTSTHPSLVVDMPLIPRIGERITVERDRGNTIDYHQVRVTDVSYFVARDGVTHINIQAEYGA